MQCRYAGESSIRFFPAIALNTRGTTLDNQAIRRRKPFVAQELIVPEKIRVERGGAEVHARRFIVERQFLRLRQLVRPARIPRVALVASGALDVVATVSGTDDRHVRGIDPKSEFGSGAQGIGPGAIGRCVRTSKIDD